MVQPSKVKIIKALQKIAIEGATVELHRGNGYWYFAYTIEQTETRGMVYDTKTVYTMRLNDMTEQQWIDEGTSFVENMNERGEA